MLTFHFLVGTFNTPHIYTLAFSLSPDSRPHLRIVHRSNAVGSHSWLHLSRDKKRLYATAWTEPPSLVAYAIEAPHEIRQINSVQTASRSGYVCASDQAVYSAGGASGEVFAIDAKTGGFAGLAAGEKSSSIYRPLQVLSFVDETKQKDDGSVMDFGGLRHGAHSADLSPDGRAIYIADIGRNCIWTYSTDPRDGKLTLGEKHISPRSHDGPRHVWPHPSGKYVYCLQEHSSMVDVFEVDEEGTHLKHVQGVRIIPESANENDFWADEVRTSFSNKSKPKYLYASVRGLKEGQKGYVSAFRLLDEGRIDDGGQAGNEQAAILDLWESPTSGGWANAIQPGPTVNGVEYIALTDSEEGFVMVLSWDGQEFREVARVKLDDGAGAATAVWLW
jgi:carboxy-cis,cis-muconate cyclase